MDSDYYQLLVEYLSTNKYPAQLRAAESKKRQLKKVSECFLLKNGELYHIRQGRFTTDAQKRRAESQKVVIDANGETERITREFHCSGIGGQHLGQPLTQEKVMQKYWWPGLAAEIREFVKNCQFCQNSRHPRNVARAEVMKRFWAARRALKRQQQQLSVGADQGAAPSPPKKKRMVCKAGGGRPARVPSSSNDGGSSLNNLEKSVLLLQQELYEGQLQYQAEKKAAVTKFNLALDEFRRHVAEQRMAARGVNVSNLPVDIPPGLEGF